MKVFRSSREAAGHLVSPAVAIGNFDGVHLGHQALFSRAAELVRARGGQTAALTFSPHPARFFNPDLAPPLVTTEEQKLGLLEACGLDAVVVETFDADYAAMTPLVFVREVLVRRLHAAHVVVGKGFVFGQRRAGNLEVLCRLGQEYGFEAHGIEYLRAESIVVSSSKIREFLLLGRVRGASALLGREYRVQGRVVRGRGRGHTIGIPTANIDAANEILPRRGVYAGRVMLEDRTVRDAVINIGTNPTFEKAAVMTLEVHVLDFSADLYGQRLEVCFARRLRDERRFSSAAELIEAIGLDIQTARVLLSERGGEGTPRSCGPVAPVREPAAVRQDREDAARA